MIYSRPIPHCMCRQKEKQELTSTLELLKKTQNEVEEEKKHKQVYFFFTILCTVLDPLLMNCHSGKQVNKDYLNFCLKFAFLLLLLM